MCYVIQPSGCNDLVESTHNLGELYSEEACEKTGSQCHMILEFVKEMPISFLTQKVKFNFHFRAKSVGKRMAKRGPMRWNGGRHHMWGRGTSTIPPMYGWNGRQMYR